MGTETRRFVRMIVSALSSGFIAAGGVTLGAFGSDGNVNPGIWVLAGVTGIVAVFKDLQSALSSPPQPPGSPQPPVVDPSGNPVR